MKVDCPGVKLDPQHLDLYSYKRFFILATYVVGVFWAAELYDNVINWWQEVAEPTPRQERIGHDYSNEFPKVEVESRRVTSAGTERSVTKSANKNFDNIKLHDDEVHHRVELYLTYYT